MENISIESIKQEYFGGKAVSSCIPHESRGRNLPFSVFVQVDEGSYFVEIDDVWHEVPAGKAVLVPSRVMHGIKMEQDGVVNWAHVRYSIIGSLDVFSFYHTPFILNEDISQTVRDCCYHLAYYHSEGPDAEQNQMTKIIQIKYYLTALLQVIISNSTPNTNHFAQLMKMENIYQSLKYITDNIHKKLSIEELAVQSNLSVSRFYNVFKSATNLSPMEYVIKEKLKKSCQMLIFENKSVSEIAWELGYDDPLYFSKTFKSKFGVSPTDYKKKFIPHNP